MAPFVEMNGITKKFGELIANNDVSFSVERGEIHAIVGENGAGKTTLMNILYGLLQPDQGSIRINTNKIEMKNPSVAIGHGLGMVHQHFMLVPSFSVMQNITLGNAPKKWFFYDKNRARKRINEIIQTFGLNVDPDSRVNRLTVGAKQKVEIIKILYRGADLIILDEPTAVLTPQEVNELFRTMRYLVEKDKTIIFISHKLKEVLGISDRITVMKKGKIVGTVNSKSIQLNQLAEMMVGQELSPVSKKKTIPSTKEILKVEGLWVKEDRGINAVCDLTLEIKGGEIVGLAGVEGNGQKELAESISGLRPVTRGKIFLLNKEITNSSIGERRKLGMAYIPEDRKERGTNLFATIEENLFLGCKDITHFRHYGVLDNKKITQHTEFLMKKFDVRAPGSHTIVSDLSGGNIQKIILARELSSNCLLLVACQPTRGLDIGAAEFVYKTIFEFKEQGNAVLLISSDLDEIISVSDRILVMFGGKIVGEIAGDKADEKEIGYLMTGVV